MPSYEYQSFMDSYFGDPYMAWHDGLDEWSLVSLTGEEREQAEKMLIEALPSGDYRVAAGLKALRSQQAAPLLKDRLDGLWGDELVQTALALWQIEKYPPAVPALISVLKTPDWGTQINAAMALAHVRTPESVAALLDALGDPDQLVRHHVAASLLTMHGIAHEVAGDDITIGVMMDEPKKRAAAVAEVKQMIAGKKLVEDDAAE